MSTTDWLSILGWIIPILTVALIAHKISRNFVAVCFAVGFCTFFATLSLSCITYWDELSGQPDRVMQWFANVPFAFSYFVLGFVVATLAGIPFLVSRYIRARRERRLSVARHADAISAR